jgi:hypothetical protein
MTSKVLVTGGGWIYRFSYRKAIIEEELPSNCL